MELNPTDALDWLEAGTIFCRLGWSSEAMGAFREAVRLNAKLPGANLRLGRAYDAFDRPAEVTQAYEALLHPRPKLPAVHRRVAELYTTRIRDPAKAQVHLRQAEGAGIRPGTGS